jgi:hypothetical protein
MLNRHATSFCGVTPRTIKIGRINESFRTYF